jgi:hypothetical protein
MNLIIAVLNKSIGNKNYHLHNLDELFEIMQKKNLTTLEKYYLKSLYTDIPLHILKEKLLKSLDKDKQKIFFQKAEELGLNNENFQELVSSF